MSSVLVAQHDVFAQLELNLGPGQSQGNNTSNNNPGANTTQSSFTIPPSMVSTYKDSIGGLHIVGQVQNNFTFPINFVQVAYDLEN